MLRNRFHCTCIIHLWSMVIHVHVHLLSHAQQVGVGVGGILQSVCQLLVRQLVTLSLVCFCDYSWGKSTIGKLTSHLWHSVFCICGTLAFWNRNDESTFDPIFLVAILIFCHLKQHVAGDCVVLADFVWLFHCVF